MPQRLLLFVMVLGICASLLAVDGCRQSPDPALALTAADSALVNDWLFRSCEVGEKVLMRDKLAASGAKLVPLFKAALDNGLPMTVQMHVDSELTAEFPGLRKQMIDDRGRALMDTSLLHGVPFASSGFDTAYATTLTPASFKADEEHRLAAAYGARALSGLAICGDTLTVQAIAANAADPRSHAAQLALDISKHRFK